MLKLVHRVAGIIAILTIAAFWLSTVLTEVVARRDAIIAVKTTIPWGLLILVPALAAAGGSGLTLARGRRGGLLGTKARRMPIIAANGFLILVPAALYLAHKAQAAELDTTFYVVQGAELVAGAVNLTLLAFNVRDGMRLSGRVHARSAVTR